MFYWIAQVVPFLQVAKHCLRSQLKRWGRLWVSLLELVEASLDVPAIIVSSLCIVARHFFAARQLIPIPDHFARNLLATGPAKKLDASAVNFCRFPLMRRRRILR